MLDETQKRKAAKKIDHIVNKFTSSKHGNPAKIHGVTVGLTSDKETFYYNFKGVMDPANGTPINKDTIFGYFSCTKAMTAMAILQLYELGKLKLSDQVSKYLPEFEQLYIVEKGTVDAKTGKFLSPPKKPTTKVTIWNLLTMTAGLSYPFLNDEYTILAKYIDPHINSINPTEELFKTEKTPLIHEPGTQFLYGHSMDWAGLIVQRITGKPLGQYLKQHVFDPVGMNSCTFHVKDQTNLLRLYRRTSKGQLVPLPHGVNLDPEIDMGGQGCFGNIEDYLKFMRIWLNYGYSPDGNVRLLNEDLVKYALKDHLPPGVTVRFDIEGIPQIPDGFTLAGMGLTKEEPATGRPVGTIYWSGLANLYYWIDLDNNLGGFWASQVFPFGDQQCFLGYCQTEMAVYDVIKGEDDDDDDDEDEEDDEGEDEKLKSKL